MDQFLRFVSSEGFAVGFGTFVCVGLWKISSFLGRRFFGESGYLTQYVDSVKESHIVLSDSHKQTALAVVAMQQGVAAMHNTLEHESDRRTDVDQKVSKVLDLVTEGGICQASRVFQLTEGDPYVESEPQSR